MVEDENDNPPQFDKPQYSGHIREDCRPGCFVAMDKPITAHDTDTGVNAKFSLSLQGQDSHFFSLLPSGYLALTGKLDRELKNKHILRVIATDKGRDHIFHHILINIIYT